MYLAPAWEFYFHSKDQGYCVNNYSYLLRTTNNGGHTNIDYSYKDYEDILIYPNPVLNQFSIQ